MELEEAAQLGNQAARDACEKLLDRLGGEKEYLCAITSLASTLMFHVYRVGRYDGKAVELLQAALNDVVQNVEGLGGDKIEIIVRRRG
jgi:hypothetical protein